MTGGKSLKHRMEFIMKIGFGLTYNDGVNAVRANIETAGNSLQALSNVVKFKKNNNGQNQFINIAYAEYAKFDLDYTHLFNIDKNNSIACHAAFGIAYPYGKIVSLYHEHTDIEKGIYLTRNAIYNYPLTRKPLPLERQDPEEARPYLPNATLRYLKQYVQKGHDLKDTLKARKESSSLYVYKKDILSFSFGLEGVKEVKVEDLYSCFVQDQKEVARLEKVKELLNLIHKAIKNNKKKEINLEQDLNTAKDRRKYLTYGQRIYQYQAEISKGDKVLERDGESIPLNPRLDAPHNANYYFKKYQKAKAALVILKDLIEKCKEDSLYLEKKEREIVDGTPRDIRELKSELLEEGYIKEKQGRNTVYKVSKKHSYDPHYLIVPEGKIGFGRNGLQNEELTFKQARKEDTFLHVKDYPGAHVVILEGKGDEILRLAGELCLYLSHLSSGTIRRMLKRIQARSDLSTF